MAAKIKALQQWCKVQCDGYRDVSVNNMTSSWKNGLAFCAIIHRFRPDLIDYESLSKENVFENNKLAFDTAESLGIPALLDADDMVAMSVPDKLCIVTYLSQYYNHFSRCERVGGPNVSVAVKRSANYPAVNDVKRPALDSVSRHSVQESAGLKRNTWQDRCCVCDKKVYLMERHMSNNRLYHRQCFRHHERASFVAVHDVDLQSSDSVVDMHDNVTADIDCGHKAASVSVSTASASKSSDTLSLTSVNRIAHTSPKTQSPVSSSSCLPSLESSTAAATSEDASVKPSLDREHVAVSDSARGSCSQVSSAADDISVHEPTASAHVQTGSADSHRNEVVTSRSASTAVNVTVTQKHEAGSVEVRAPEEELVLNSACSVKDSSEQMESAVSDAAEALEPQQIERSDVDIETAKKTLLENIPVSSSESSSSSPSSFAVAVTEHAADSVAKGGSYIRVYRPAPLLPKVRSLAPVAEDVSAQQPTFSHSSSLSVCRAASPSAAAAAAKSSSESDSPSVHVTSDAAPTAACAVVASSSSESPCVTVHHVVKDTHHVVPHRPAPRPPSQAEQNTASSQQPASVTQSDSQHMMAKISTTPEPTELLQEVAAASLHSDVHTEQLSSKDAINKHCDELTASGSSCDLPVPTPRHSHLLKPNVLSTASLSPAESPMVTVDDAAVAVKPPPVPKPRKKSQALQEPAEVGGKEKPGGVVNHRDIELSHADGSVAVESKTNDTVVRDSCMFAGTSEEPGKQIPVTHVTSPRLPTVSSSPQPCEENKSPSLSPALPVKYPRSKKRCAAPMPPSSVGPVSPNLQSPKPEGSSAINSEPRVLGSQQQSIPAVSTSAEAGDKSADKSSTVNSEESSKPVRKKITPHVKFTFEKDVFRPGKIGMETTSSVEVLKPSRPAPPCPAVAAVTKRKISAEEPLPVDFIKQRLTVLDAELKKLEQDGCHMEEHIRSVAGDDDDVIMSDWLVMVQKKNELVREESQLIYRLRQQELEDRHSRVEYELRRLMAIPEDKKTEAQRSREGKLLQQLLVTVHRRNNIVDSMEEDRKRYLAEDEEIDRISKASQGTDRKKKAG